MVGTEMPGCALAMNGIVEHAAEVRPVDVPVMHAEADDTADPDAVMWTNPRLAGTAE